MSIYTALAKKLIFFFFPYHTILGFPGDSEGKKLPAIQETQVLSLGKENPLVKEMTTLSTFLPGEFHGEGSLVGYSPRGPKESNTTGSN